MNRKQRRFMRSTAYAASPSNGIPQADHDFREAVRHLQDGRLQQSRQAHRRVLARLPRHAPSLHHMGLIAFKTNAPVEAVDYIQQSVAADPSYHQAWLNLAVVLGELRRLDEAIEAGRRCIALQPTHAEAHSILGNLYRNAGRNADAIAAYAASLEHKADQPSVLARLGEVLLLSGKTADALARCRDALALAPDLEEARILERRILASSGQLDAVETMVEKLSDDPAQRAKSYDQLGVLLGRQGSHAEAVALHHRAVACAPNQADFHFNLAVALDALGKRGEALAAYQAGLAIDPNRAEAYANVGTLLKHMDMHAGAITALEHAIKLDPTLAVAHYNLAVIFKQLGRFEDARTAFAKSIEHAPQSLINRFEFNNLRRVICDWDGLDQEEELCLELFRIKNAAISPFQLISTASDQADQLEAGRRHAGRIIIPDKLKFQSHRTGSNSGGRIRIGYLSADFIEHATAMLLVEVLENTDRERFEIFGYCYSGDDGSELRRRIAQSFDHFIDIREMPNHDAAQRIHADGIDILVDLKGYTRDSRPEILAYRPAPIQVNYLGYPATMGADFIDYILADAVVTPMHHQAHYTEQIVQLPHCYQPNDRKREIASDPMTRAQFGLPDDAFVFCSFNNSYKFNATTFDIWMRLVERVPGSVLWLLAPNPTCRANLQQEAEKRGIDPNRIIFADRLPIAQHLARHRLADLFLDSLPCNAHTTASDALWAGLPVLTCLGETFSGRVAGSLLTAMDLPELITTDIEHYERLALSLAHEPDRLRSIRTKLSALRDEAPLFDSVRYARNLEQAYETMVDLMKSGAAPRPFSVVENSSAIRTVPAPVTPIATPRVLYERCPLCNGEDIPYQIEAKITGHPLYKPELPPTMKWRSCNGCAHVFAEGYFTPEACEVVFSATHANQKVGTDVEGQRKVSAKIVERVARYAPRGDWLDIGVGNGSLLFTAAEWGYEAVGTDLRSENVDTLHKLGFEAHCTDIEELNFSDRFSVVSMADVLEHVPFPGRALAAVHRMMQPGGALFVSMPNMDSIVWRVLDASGTNPYWGELEHYHNFSRARLTQLLEAHGFTFAEYNISERYRSCMEVIARRT